MTARNPDPVQSTRGLATNLKLYIISLISHYIAYFTYCTKSILFSLISLISFIFYYVKLYPKVLDKGVNSSPGVIVFVTSIPSFFISLCGRYFLLSD